MTSWYSADRELRMEKMLDASTYEPPCFPCETAEASGCPQGFRTHSPRTWSHMGQGQHPFGHQVDWWPKQNAAPSNAASRSRSERPFTDAGDDMRVKKGFNTRNMTETPRNLATAANQLNGLTRTLKRAGSCPAPRRGSAASSGSYGDYRGPPMFNTESQRLCQAGSMSQRDLRPSSDKYGFEDAIKECPSDYGASPRRPPLQTQKLCYQDAASDGGRSRSRACSQKSRTWDAATREVTPATDVSRQPSARGQPYSRGLTRSPSACPSNVSGRSICRSASSRAFSRERSGAGGSPCRVQRRPSRERSAASPSRQMAGSPSRQRICSSPTRRMSGWRNY